MNDSTNDTTNNTTRSTFPLGKWAVLGLVLLLAATVLAEYPGLRARLSSGWPYLLILLCPLMHIFMHRGHGGHGGHSGHGDHETKATPGAELPRQLEETQD